MIHTSRIQRSLTLGWLYPFSNNARFSSAEAAPCVTIARARNVKNVKGVIIRMTKLYLTPICHMPSAMLKVFSTCWTTNSENDEFSSRLFCTCCFADPTNPSIWLHRAVAFSLHAVLPWNVNSYARWPEQSILWWLVFKKLMTTFTAWMCVRVYWHVCACMNYK